MDRCLQNDILSRIQILKRNIVSQSVVENQDETQE